MSHVLLDTPEDMGFDRMIHLGMGQWGVYACEPHIVGAIGTPMLCRGTKSEVMRQVKAWCSNIEAYHALLFTWRQAHLNVRRARLVAA